ncbi:hypothetical protein ACFX1R_010697 [Malus domestica]
MLERHRRCCEGTAMGAIILYFQSGLGIRNQTATAGIDRRPGHGRGLRVILLQPHLRKRLHRSTL